MDLLYADGVQIGKAFHIVLLRLNAGVVEVVPGLLLSFRRQGVDEVPIASIVVVGLDIDFSVIVLHLNVVDAPVQHLLDGCIDAGEYDWHNLVAAVPKAKTPGNYHWNIVLLAGLDVFHIGLKVIVGLLTTPLVELIGILISGRDVVILTELHIVLILKSVRARGEDGESAWESLTYAWLAFSRRFLLPILINDLVIL